MKMGARVQWVQGCDRCNGCGSVRVACERSRIGIAVLELVGAGARRRGQFSRAAARSRRPCGRRARPRDLRHRVPQLPWPGSSRRRARRVEPASVDARAERSRRRADPAGASGVAQGPHLGGRALTRDDVKALAAYIHSVLALAPGQGAPPPGPPVELKVLVGDAAAGRAIFRGKVRELSLRDGRSQAASARGISVPRSCRICGLPEDGEEAAADAVRALLHRLRR